MGVNSPGFFPGLFYFGQYRKGNTMDKILVEYVKGKGLQQVKVFGQDTIVFFHTNTEDFLKYIKNVQTKEKVGITIYLKKYLNIVEDNLNTIQVMNSTRNTIDAKTNLLTVKNTLPYTKIVVNYGDKEKKTITMNSKEEYNLAMDAISKYGMYESKRVKSYTEV